MLVVVNKNQKTIVTLFQFVLKMQIVLLFFILLLLIDAVYLHGMMLYPPQRGSMWRFYKNFPINYNDNGLNCGNNYKMCGICGDSSNVLQSHQPHSINGRFGKISSKYPTRLLYKQNLTVAINVTANHKGYFYYEYCNLDLYKWETKNCFQQFTPNLVLYLLPANAYGTILNNIGPINFYCKHCILRWTWITQKNWVQKPCHMYKDSSCGQQEIFRNCADFSVE